MTMSRLALCLFVALPWLVSHRDGVRADEDRPENQATKTTTVSRETPQLELMVIEENIIKYTNAQRQRYGLPALVMDENLVRSARQHAIWMASNRTLQHTRQMVAENIAMGYHSSHAAVQGWMNSSGHRANILNGSYRRIGVAAYQAHDGSIYWCQQFLR
jgi:uncharacterized protein YkwD